MVNRWVTAALILTVLSLLGSAIVISQVSNPVAVSQEQNASCSSQQFATSESTNGSFQCGKPAIPYSYIVNITGTTITAYPTMQSLSKFSGTDCGSVINSAANALVSNLNTGGIFINAGVYSCTTAINIQGERLIGADYNTVTLQWASLSTIAIVTGSQIENIEFVGTSSLKTFVLVNTSQALIYHDEFIAGSSASTNGILINQGGINAKEYFISDNIFSRIKNGIVLQTASSTRINNIASGGLITNLINDSSTGSNQFSNIGGKILLNTGVKNDSISNCVSPCSITDNSGQTNYACPPTNGLICVSQTAVSTELAAGCAINQFVTTESANGGLGCGAQLAVTTEMSATCPVNQFATGENGSGFFQCSAQGGVTTEKAAGCASSQQFVTTESANGDFSCGIVTYGTCPANQFATAITTTTLNCGAQLAVSTEAIASCSTGQFATTESAAGGFGCGNPNIQFVTNASTCTDTTSGSAVMAGMQVNYTPNGTGKVSVTLNFKIATPATVSLNSQWQLAFGTGKEPVCNAAATGTLVGQKYEQGTWAAVASFVSPSVTAGVFTLTPGTRYWWDLQITDSSAAAWTYSLPQLTIVES